MNADEQAGWALAWLGRALAADSAAGDFSELTLNAYETDEGARGFYAEIAYRDADTGDVLTAAGARGNSPGEALGELVAEISRLQSADASAADTPALAALPWARPARD